VGACLQAINILRALTASALTKTLTAESQPLASPELPGEGEMRAIAKSMSLNPRPAPLPVGRGRLGGGLRNDRQNCERASVAFVEILVERAAKNPHPGPLPDYRARGKCARSIAHFILHIPRLAPLPVSRGRLGGGLPANAQNSVCLDRERANKNPHPGPLPDYRARGNAIDGSTRVWPLSQITRRGGNARDRHFGFRLTR